MRAQANRVCFRHGLIADRVAGRAFIAEQSAGTTGLDGSEHVRSVGSREVTFTMHVHAVPAVRLDDWIAERGIAQIDLIKIDVEGAEPASLLALRVR